jgi:hypothetical protein
LGIDGLSKTRIPLTFRYGTESSSSKLTFGIDNFKPSLDQNIGVLSKFRSQNSLSYTTLPRSLQPTLAGQALSSGSGWSMEVIPEYRTNSSFSTFGNSPSTSVFDPNYFQSRPKYGNLNLSSQLTPYLSLQTSSRYLGTTSTPGLQSSYMVPQAILPSRQSTLSGLSLPAFANIEIGDTTISPTEYRTGRNMMLFIMPNVVQLGGQ